MLFLFFLYLNLSSRCITNKLRLQRLAFHIFICVRHLYKRKSQPSTKLQSAVWSAYNHPEYHSSRPLLLQRTVIRRTSAVRRIARLEIRA
jgi:hypothetical protein